MVDESTILPQSPSSRRAWIEIIPSGLVFKIISVALLAEGVDRNQLWRVSRISTVRSPSSRRAWIEILRLSARLRTYGVALLAEGVDRNNAETGQYEMRPVALLAEGVDRNNQDNTLADTLIRSPSSRRAWIEISPPYTRLTVPGWSPSSRRAWIEIEVHRGSERGSGSRPPRGGRG